MNFLKLKLFCNILHMNCLLGFRKMTFTIHLIVTSLAGIIFRPLFTTFCSYFCYYLSRKKNCCFLCKAHGTSLKVWWICFSGKKFLASTATSWSLFGILQHKFCKFSSQEHSCLSFFARYSRRCFIPSLKSFLNFPPVVPFVDRWNSFLKKKCFIASTAICLSLIFLIIFSNVFHILWIFSFGIKLQRSQQHFRPRTSTYFWQWDYLLIHFMLTLLHFLRIQ